MSAYRTNFRSFISHVNISAVAAFPAKRRIAFKGFISFVGFQKFFVPCFMSGLYFGNALKFFSQFFKAFFSGFSCHSCIHICPFKVFTLSGILKIGVDIVNSVKLLKPHFCVFFFLIGSFQIKSCQLLISCFFCSGGKERVFISCL